MSKNIKKILIFIGCTFWVICCVLGCTNYIKSSREHRQKYPHEQAPIKVLSIRIDENQREELFTQLKAFSKKHHLEFYLSRVDSYNSFFMVLQDKNINIAALSKPIDTTKLDFAIFEQDPTNPPSQEKVNTLMNDLKSFVLKVPSVEIIMEE